jgi:hypothetical protein
MKHFSGRRRRVSALFLQLFEREKGEIPFLLLMAYDRDGLPNHLFVPFAGVSLGKYFHFPGILDGSTAFLPKKRQRRETKHLAILLLLLGRRLLYR